MSIISCGLLFLSLILISNCVIFLKENPVDVNFNLSSSQPFDFVLLTSLFLSNSSDEFISLRIDGGSSPKWIESSVTCSLKGVFPSNFAKRFIIGNNGKFLYLCDSLEGVKILDVQVTEIPILIHTIEALDANDVFISDEIVYLGDYVDDLVIYDVHNKTNPKLMSKTYLTKHVEDSVVVGDILYIAANTHGILLYNISNISKPIYMKSVSTYAAKSLFHVPSRSALFVADHGAGIKIVSIIDPSNPQIIGSLGTNQAYDIFVEGDFLYVSDSSEGLKIVNISTLSQPVLVGECDTWTALSVVVKGNTAFVSDQKRGVIIIDVKNKTSPYVIGSMDLGYSYYSDTRNNTVFVANKHEGLKFLHCGDLQLSGYPEDVYCGNETVNIIATGSSNPMDIKKTSFKIHYNNVCGSHGVCVPHNHSCICRRSYFDDKCDNWNCFGIGKDHETVCSSHGICIESDVCKCTDPVYHGENCELYYCHGISMTEVNNVCGGHGNCIHPDVCVCSKNYSPLFLDGECTEWKCFGVNHLLNSVCKGNGDCISPDNCDCKGVFTGRNCDYNFVLILVSVSGSSILIGFFLFFFCCCVTVSIIFCMFLFCCLILIFFTTISCCSSVILRQKKVVSRYRRLKNFDELLQEQLLTDEDDMSANLKINPELFKIPMDQIHIESLLGAGGSNSMVFRAKYSRMDVAFKCFKTKYLFEEQNVFNFFEKEVSILSSLAHENIVRFWGCSLKPPRVGIVMEYLPNGEIFDFIIKYRKEHNNQVYPKKKSLVRDIVSAMSYLHTRSIIHRDLKCENVLISELETCKLLDFGVSRIVRESAPNQFTTKIGTSFYMAPEVVISDHYDSKCDVFSFSILLYVILSEIESPYGDNGSFNVQFRVANDPNYRPSIERLRERMINDIELPNEYDIGDESNDRERKRVEFWIELVKMCWKNNPEERPSFQTLQKKLEEFS